MSESISVSTQSNHLYEYHVGEGLLETTARFIEHSFGKQKLIIIIDDTVYQYHYSRILNVFESTFTTVRIYRVPPGENSKNVHQFSEIVDFILKEGVERKTPILAVGGGVVGDLSGFVAASVLRGVPLVHMPTSLLAMVDSSIGGKTGINHSTGKNLIGSFYQPKAVFADINFLETLPHKEWVNGLSEIIKYGFIAAPDILNTLQTLTGDHQFAPPKEWMSIIKQSASIKINTVQKDVHEGGIRAFLNFGHTYGHVLERAGMYSKFSHGEAIFAGMYGAISASNKLGGNIDSDLLSIFKPLYNINLSDIPDVKELITWMHHDKKVDKNEIRLILLHTLSEPYVHTVLDKNLLISSWTDLIQQFS